MATDNEKKYLDLEGLSQVFDMIEETYVSKESYSSEKSELEGKINAEVERATAKEEELDGKINDLESKADSDKSELEGKISDLDSKVDTKVEELEGKISDLDTKVDGKVEEFTNALNEEIERAKGEEKAIADDLAEEIVRATGAESVLQDNIDAEAQAREDADAELQDAIDALGSEADEKYFAEVEYVATEHVIKFMNGNGEQIGEIDANDFVKDGMIESVELTTTTGTTDDVQVALKITFNTHNGHTEKEDVILPLGDLFDVDNYYNKEESDEKFVSWTFETGRGRQIVLDNDGMILGLPNEGELEDKVPANGACNLLMLNKWNVVDLGSVKYPINLNGTKGAHPTYNDNIEIAFVSDVETAKGDLESAIEAEQERAEQAEKELQDNIDTLDEKVDNAVEDLEGKITAEQERAEAKEGELDQAIKDEQERAEAKEEELNTAIENEAQAREAEDGRIWGKVNDNDTRAQEAEKALDDKIEAEKVERWNQDNQIKGLITAEQERAEAKETELEGKISDLESKVDSNKSELEGKIEDEAQAREDADADLQEAIDAEVTRATEAEEKLQENIDTKQDKGDYVEYTPYGERKTIQLRNYDSLSGIKTDGLGVNLAMVSKWDIADFGSTQLPINLNGSAERPTYNDDKEIALLSDVEAEASKREQGDTNLFNALRDAKTEYKDLIKAEETARETADTELNNAITGLTESVNTQFSEVNGKISDLESADETLQGNIDTLEGDLNEFKTEVKSTYETKEDAYNHKTYAEETFAKKTEIPSLNGFATEEWVEAKGYFDDVEYVSDESVIKFTSNGEVVGTIDTTDFIKDGMIDNVILITDPTKDNGNAALQITFNTDAGKDVITVNIGDLFNADNYFTASQVQEKINAITESLQKHVQEFGTYQGKTDLRLDILENSVTNTLPADIAGLKSAIDILNGGVDVEGSVDKKIKDAIAELALKLEEVQRAFDEINNH